MSFDIPILYVCFNRPKTTSISFDLIRKLKPKTLYVHIDGPRENSNDYLLCEEVDQITNKIDWDCNFFKKKCVKNKGCKIAVSSALNWFFSNEEMGIILEDDILPVMDFFDYSKFCLEKYYSDTRIMMISGLNVAEKFNTDYSFFFSWYGGIWGWATWKRAWQLYDLNISKWNDNLIRRKLLNFFPEKIRGQREKMYNDLYNNKIDTWDLQWGFSRYINNGLSIIPAYNLIKNIGYLEGGTHISERHPWDNLSAFDFKNPIIPAPFLISDMEYDFIHLGI